MQRSAFTNKVCKLRDIACIVNMNDPSPKNENRKKTTPETCTTNTFIVISRKKNNSIYQNNIIIGINLNLVCHIT